MKCDNCGSKDVSMKGNPYAEHVKFTCQSCENERELNTNHLRPEALQYGFPSNKSEADN